MTILSDSSASISETRSYYFINHRYNISLITNTVTPPASVTSTFSIRPSEFFMRVYIMETLRAYRPSSQTRQPEVYRDLEREQAAMV